MQKYSFSAFIAISKDSYFFDLIQQNLYTYDSFEKVYDAKQNIIRDLPMQAQEKIDSFLEELFEYTLLNVLESQNCATVGKHFRDFINNYFPKNNFDEYNLFDLFTVYILSLTQTFYNSKEYAHYLGARQNNSFIGKLKHNTNLKYKHARSIGTYLKLKHSGYSIEDAIRMTYELKGLSVAEIVYLQKQVENIV